MGVARGFQFMIMVKLFQPKLADRLQHCQTRRAFSFRLTQEAFAYKRFEKIDRSWRASYGLSRFECAAADENGQPTERALFILVEKIVTPLNCVAQSLLTGRQIARTAGEQLQG